jgi:hypothetical protein
MGRALLFWLVNRIGEAKLRKSVDKSQNRWPGQQPFVSTLLKWYNLRVPVAVFAPVRIPVYCFYVLCRLDGTEVKIGMTGGRPASRHSPCRTVQSRRCSTRTAAGHSLWAAASPKRCAGRV